MSADVLAAARPVAPLAHVRGHWAIAEFLRSGPAPLTDPVPGMSDRGQLHVATVIPPFRRGGGGHNIICQVVHHLERLGHTC